MTTQSKLVKATTTAVMVQLGCDPQLFADNLKQLEDQTRQQKQQEQQDRKTAYEQNKLVQQKLYTQQSAQTQSHHAPAHHGQLQERRTGNGKRR